MWTRPSSPCSRSGSSTRPRWAYSRRGPASRRREDYQIERLHRIAIDAGLDPDIAEMYREFVVAEAKKRHQRIADAGGDPGVLDVFA